MYKRIMLKISGESLQGKKEFGIDYDILHDIAKQIIDVQKAGIQVAVVTGAGNIWRYRDCKDSGIERSASDAIGMLATIMDAVAMQASIESQKAQCRVCSAVHVPQIVEPYLRRRAIRHLEKNRIVICAGGTGNPYFTTDSAAALRGLELNCDVLLKATRVDGVYDSDPEKNPKTKRLPDLTYQEVLEKDLYVMDQAAISLCKEGNLPIMVFDMTKKGNIKKAALGKKIGSIVHG